MARQLLNLMQIQSLDDENIYNSLRGCISDDKSECYIWASNRLLKCHLNNNQLSDDDDETSEDELSKLKLSPFATSSTPHIRSHVYYIWNKMFTHPNQPSKMDIRFVGPRESVLNCELSRWIFHAISLYAPTKDKNRLILQYKSLKFLLNIFMKVSLNGEDKRRDIFSIDVLFNSKGVLKGFKVHSHWIDASSCLKHSTSSSRTPFKVFAVLFKGLKASELDMYKLKVEMMNMKECPDVHGESLERVVDAFDKIGMCNDDIDCFIRMLVAVFHINEVYCDEFEGRLRMYNEDNLKFAAEMLKLDSSDLKNSIILKFKRNSTSPIVEGFSNASEANNQRNNLISFLYKVAVHNVFHKFNTVFNSCESDDSRSINLMAAPTFTHESSASYDNIKGGCLLDHYDFLLNFCTNYLLECYKQTIELAFVDSNTTQQTLKKSKLKSKSGNPTVVAASSPKLKPKSGNPTVVPDSSPTHYDDLLREGLKKEDSFCKKLCEGFGKKNTQKHLFEWFHKWSKINPTIISFKKDVSRFGLLQTFVENEVISYVLQDVCSISAIECPPNIIDTLNSSKLSWFSNTESRNCQLLNDIAITFDDILQFLSNEKRKISLRTAGFINCLMISETKNYHEYVRQGSNDKQVYGDFKAQILQYSLKQVLSGSDYPELIPMSTFIPRYARIALQGLPNLSDPSVEEAILKRCNIAPSQVKQNFVALSTQQIANLEHALIRYHNAVTKIQSCYRRWKARKFYSHLLNKAQIYKETMGEILLDFYSKATEFKEFAKKTYFHDLERADRALIKKIYNESEKQIPDDSKFWASVVVVEYGKPVYFRLLSHDLCVISGDLDQKETYHLPLGKLINRLESKEAKETLDRLKPGLILTCTNESNLFLEARIDNDMEISVWGHWLNLNRNFSGDLRISSGIVKTKTSYNLFDYNEFKTSIAEGLITKNISMEMVELECLVPIILNGHSSSIHDSPLTILLIDYQPLESLRSPDMQREVRLKMGNLLSLGSEDKTSRMWSKIHSQRNLFNKDTTLASQIVMIEKRRDAGGEIEEADDSLKLESSVERVSRQKGKKVWSAQLHQKKMFSLK